MSPLVDQITAVLQAHRWDRCWWKCEGGTEWARAEQTHGHAAHVAERVAEALQLELGELVTIPPPSSGGPA